jgi:AcrR family transcriptional regulator
MAKSKSAPVSAAPIVRPARPRPPRRAQAQSTNPARPTYVEPHGRAHLAAGFSGSKALANITRIRFATYLGTLANEIRKARSGEKTKLKLMAAAALLLEDVGYRELNVEEICAAAGLAKGTFYIYFGAKDEFLQELAEQYVAFEKQFVPMADAQESAFAATVRWVAWYEGTFASNVGVLRCIVQMGETDAKMRKVWHSRNEFVARRAAEMVDARFGKELANRENLLFTVRTVGGMLDQSLFNRFGVQTGTGHDQPFDDDKLTRMHALLSYRSIYGCDPPASEAADVLAMLPALKSKQS